MPDLNQYLSLSDLDPFFKNAKSDDNITEAWRTQYFKDLKRIIHPPLVAFFKALNEEGRMAVIQNSDGYACRMWNTWNDAARLTPEMAQSEWDKALDELARLFAHNLTFKIVYPYECVLKKEGADAAAAFDKRVAFDQVVGKFTLGTYESWDFSHETCWNTGLPLTLSFNEWMPQGSHITSKGSVPIPPLAPAKLQETVVEFKTGNLLFADWLRIPEFTKVVRETRISLESRKGRDDHARYLAEQFGVVSVCVDDSMPGVYQDGNQVIVGKHYEDDGEIPARFTHVGSICTDLWAATFVEYERLIELVARTQPETAKQVVDAYLDEHLDDGTYGLHRMNVEPGTYYLYHFGDHEDFGELAKKSGIDFNSGRITPYFVLSKTRLLTDHAA
ncbi:hypothetical protein [Burkholderia ubonensis]|uniref:hypothetical protein n=1 Tax=Burkholderia ubonensis TaxID=101571 RepID=UPI00075BBD14|nr:hypothetical protein [Burkholderia ubonensis]KVP39727.1 hypothetical protein WJ87_05960 [Burkholderia ubonensis]